MNVSIYLAGSRKIIEALREGDCRGAEKLLEEEIRDLNPQTDPPEITAEILSVMAGIRFADGDYKKAIAYLKDAHKLYDREPVKFNYERIENLERMGDCYYLRGKGKDAKASYRQALAVADSCLNTDDPVRMEILDNLTGSLIAENKAREALKFCLLLKDALNNPDHRDTFRIKTLKMWANLTLKDIYLRLGDKKKARTAEHRAMDIMEPILMEKLNPVLPARLSQTSPDLSVDSDTSLSDLIWNKLETHQKSLPVLLWRSPDLNKPVSAIIVCIHGLGLTNRAYEPLGRLLASRGLAVVALDVRGFGSWAGAKGFDRVNFDACVEDIESSLHVVRKRNPGIPLFLLGESMGGGIAIRTAAKYPRLIDGVVSSVPAAKRFQQRKTELKVAFRFLKGPGTSFDIGSQIIEQATVDPELRQHWAEDPKARLSLSPLELLRFDRFMRDNVRSARKVKHLPVLVVQGLQDRLVVPDSTYQLFNNIKSQDRTLIMLGTAEHLIFEAGQFSDLIIDTLTDWVHTHAADESNSLAVVDGLPH